jgi:type IV pilus assembly protein PilW
LSLVELLIGLSIGLFVTATGLGYAMRHLAEQRSVATETRLAQELRTSADLIARNLRRAGHWGAASQGLWSPAASPVAGNPYAALAPAASASNAVGFGYSRDAVENDSLDLNEQFGFRLRQGVLEMLLGGTWQALTDAGTLTVTAFSATPVVQEIELGHLCANPCTGTSSTCPPRRQLRSLALLIGARSTTDARVQRSLGSQVRVRNDVIVGSCS